VLWESFENPSDTYVPGKSYFFTSWKSSTDPSSGNHTMGVDMTGSFLHCFILNYESNGDRYFVYNDNELKLNDNSSVRFQIGWDGIEREFLWNENEKRWIEIQKGPHNQLFKISCFS